MNEAIKINSEAMTVSARDLLVSETDMDDKTLGDFFRAINKERRECK